MAETYTPPVEPDYGSMSGMTQEDLNRRLLMAMLQQGSSRYDQAMLADTLQRSRGPTPLGPRGRGKVGEANDFMTAMRPGLERSSAMEMVKQLRAKDQQFMENLMRGGGGGQKGAPWLNATQAPPIDPSAGMLQQADGNPALGINPGSMAGGPAGIGNTRKPPVLAPGLTQPLSYPLEEDPLLGGSTY